MKINASRLSQYWENVVAEKTSRTVGHSVCWLWIGTYIYTPQLYARFGSTGAVQCAAAMQCKDVPGKVSHRCSNPLCVNPTHLTYAKLTDRERRYSAFTGKLLKPKLADDQAIIRSVLHAREVCHIPGKLKYGKFKVEHLVRKTGVSEAIIKRILLKAPLYDLLDEIKELELARIIVQTAPHKTVDTLTPAELSLFNRNLSLPEIRNAKAKV